MILKMNKLLFKKNTLISLILIILVFNSTTLSSFSQSQDTDPEDHVQPGDSPSDDGLEIIEIKRDDSSSPKSNSPSDTRTNTVLKGYVSKIPVGTKLKITIETPINEDTTALNEEIKATVLKNIILEKQIIIPSGSEVIGEITEIVPSKRFHRAGRAKIEFKSIMTSDGLNIPINATVLTHKGVIKGKYTRKTGLISGASVLAPIAAGAGIGALIDSSPVGIGLGAAGGAILGFGIFFYQKGNKLDISAGRNLDIELTEDAFLPKEEIKSETDNSVTSEENENKDKDSVEKDSKNSENDVQDFSEEENENLENSKE